jgi:predicted permease
MSRSFRMTRRLRYWLGREDRHAQLQTEMRHHIDSLTQDLMAGGMTEAGARAAANRKFGNLAIQAEDSRAAWISRWISDGVQDVRYAIRNLRRDAGFATFAILIAGLGIGFSVTVFSVVNALLLRPLPFQDPERLVWISNGDFVNFQVGHVQDLQARSRTVRELAGYNPFTVAGDQLMTGKGEPERLTGMQVTRNSFPLLGVRPFAGSNFEAQEANGDGKSGSVLLTCDLWKRRFSGNPAVIGSYITLNQRSLRIAGVLPASFDFATVFSPGNRIDVFLAFPLTERTNRQGNTLSIFGRLRPGATVAAARSEFTALSKEIARQHPERNELEARVSPLETRVNGSLRPAVFVLACAVAVVMLIVCANLSNLQLARTAARQKEIAVRAALGAGRHRLVRQMLTEGMVLSGMGAVLGFLIAVAGTRFLASLDAVSVPMLSTVRIDPAALAFTLLTAVATGVLFGLVPALQMNALGMNETLKSGGRGSGQGQRHNALRGALAVSEIAMACVLVVGAGLLIRSLIRVLDLNLGFQPEDTATLRIDPGTRFKNAAQQNAWLSDALHRVRAIPGIRSAGITDVLPLGGDRGWGVGVKGELYDRYHNHDAFVRIVTDGYFESIGIRLKAGRLLTEKDDATGKPVIVINETFARKIAPDGKAVGKVVLKASGDERAVVGVVGDVRHEALEKESGEEMYIPMRQTGDYGAVDLVVRSEMSTAQLAPALRAALRPLDSGISVMAIRTVQQLVDKAVSPRRFTVFLLSGFTLFALILASLGIYGVISYSVSQRTQEIGIRMALGASARDVQRDILLQTLRLAAMGLGIGTAASWLLTRVIGGLLFGVSPTDPATFGIMLIVLTAVAAIAGYLPARRASHIDPMAALRVS